MLLCKVCQLEIEGGFILYADQSKSHIPCSQEPKGREVTLKPNEVWEPPNTSIATKNDSDKADLSLIPLSALIAESKAFQVGERKYGRYNYTNGMEASRLVAAAMRHLTAWFDGEENDPQDGQPHLGAVRACIAMLLEQQKLGTLVDNRRGKV